MKKLTDYQKEFILENFFKKTYSINWYDIATKLLETGSCIVAGDTNIWVGGIGNFIKTKPSELAVGCTLYEFDLDYFLTSAWFKAVKESRFIELAEKKKQIEEEYNSINDLC